MLPTFIALVAAISEPGRAPLFASTPATQECGAQAKNVFVNYSLSTNKECGGATDVASVATARQLLGNSYVEAVNPDCSLTAAGAGALADFDPNNADVAAEFATDRATCAMNQYRTALSSANDGRRRLDTAAQITVATACTQVVPLGGENVLSYYYLLVLACNDDPDSNNARTKCCPSVTAYAVSIADALADGVKAFFKCHPASTQVELLDGRMARLDETEVGTHIRTPSGFEPIIAFLHREPDTVGQYYEFATDANTSLRIGPEHWLRVNGAEADPATVVVDDTLETDAGGSARVQRISMVTAPGAFHPIVPSGLYYADGVVASDYYSGMPLSAWRFGHAYATLRYKLGVPVVGEGQGPISSLAVVKSMPSIRNMPVFGSALAVLIELVNLAATHPTETTAAAATFAALVLAKKARKPLP